MTRMMLHIWFCVYFVFAGELYARNFPMDSVDEMCNEAELIVEGTYLGGNSVRIDKIYKSAPKLENEGEIINVSLLDKHTRYYEHELKVNKAVLFLIMDADNSWAPLHTITESNRGGSCGLFWIDNSTCYGYIQSDTMGPYELYPAQFFKDLIERLSGGRKIYGGFNRIPESLEMMREDIKIGLENSKIWEKIAAMGDLSAKARVMSKYLLKSTAPKDDRCSYLNAMAKFMNDNRKIAVPILVSVLENAREDDYLDATVSILEIIGPDAKPAVPQVCKLLNSPKQIDTLCVIYALESIKDNSAAPYLRPLIKHENFFTAVKACKVLATLKDVESFENMAALIPAEPNPRDVYSIGELLEALYVLDAERAKPLIEKTLANPMLRDLDNPIKAK